MKEILPGKYRHYSGKEYRVLGIGRHSETLEEFIVYQALYVSEQFGKDTIWMRPREMFFDEVEIEGVRQSRFKLID